MQTVYIQSGVSYTCAADYSLHIHWADVARCNVRVLEYVILIDTIRLFRRMTHTIG